MLNSTFSWPNRAAPPL